MAKKHLQPLTRLLVMALALSSISCSISTEPKTKQDIVPGVLAAILKYSNYDLNKTPNPNNSTIIRYTLEFDAMGTIDDFNQTITIVFQEFLRWTDPRLNYGAMNLTQINKYHRDFWIDMEYAKGVIWKPLIEYQNVVTSHFITDEMYLDESGGIAWILKKSVTLKCQFDFTDFPNDYQECSIVPFIRVHDQSLVLLKVNQDELPPTEHHLELVPTTSSPDNYFSFSLQMTNADAPTIFDNDLDGIQSSSIEYKLHIQRNPYFYLVSYVVPSIIFVTIAYCNFWIDRDSVTSRCSLSITTVLIAFSYLQRINKILPNIEYSVWIITYYNGIFIFTCFAMFEFAFVNFCVFNYNNKKKHIDDLVMEIRESLTKQKLNIQLKISKPIFIGRPKSIDQQQQMSLLGASQVASIESDENESQRSNMNTLQPGQKYEQPKPMFSMFSVFGKKPPNQVTPLNIPNALNSSILNNQQKKDQNITEKVFTPKYINEELEIDQLVEEEIKLHSLRYRSQKIEDSHKTNREPQSSFRSPKKENPQIMVSLSDSGSEDVNGMDSEEEKKQQDEDLRGDFMMNQARSIIYYKQLLEHINMLEEAKRSQNPSLNELVFSEFKIFVQRNWEKIDYLLESRTRIQIQEVFRLEKAIDFFLFRVVAENMDEFFRFAYIAFCQIFICNSFADLYNIPWLISVSTILFITQFMIQIVLNIRNKMVDEEWKFKKALWFYLTFRCLLPKTELIIFKMKFGGKKSLKPKRR